MVAPVRGGSSEPSGARRPDFASIGSMLHRWQLDEREIERHLSRRGRRHAYDIGAARIALVVVDLIPFFTDENPYAAGIVPNVNRLATAVRSSGGVVAWVVPSDGAPNQARRELFGAGVAEMYRRSGGSGDVVARLDPALEHQPGDIAVDKDGASAFFPGACALDRHLRAEQVDTVLIAGTLANVCCGSSARDALECGYRVVMVADANAAIGDAELNATLHTFHRSFGDVRAVDDLIAALGA